MLPDEEVSGNSKQYETRTEESKPTCQASSDSGVVDSWPRGIESPSVRTIEMPEYVASAEDGIEAERRELDWLLTSGVLGRSSNLARVLKYICEERFAGRGQQIKEYTIATEALGRRPDFDPTSDTIVRVTVHSLRKRLLEVYQNEGTVRPLRLVLPPGHYDPSFVPAPLQQPNPAPQEAAPPKHHEAEPAPALTSITQSHPQPAHAVQLWLAAIVVLAILIASSAWVWRHRQVARLHTLNSSAAALPLPPPQATIHALMGTGRKPYIDHSGMTWASGNYCQGGANVIVPPQKIEGTEDPPLYFGGLRGIAHCTFPVTQKLYELHFHFAETSDLPVATQLASISINAGPIIGVDVVDRAGDDGIATSIVVTGIAPENDGSIHVDFISDVSLLNAVEILPAPSASQLPVRIVVSSKPYIDSANQFWASDRYFSGGRHGLPPESAKQGNLGLYESDRIGRFRYSIPAVPGAHYKVKLYFREPWFGKENGGSGGPGSRVFDVACNNELLMKNFDILEAGGSAPVVKTFNDIQASADGRIELSFLPVVNYALVNAIEVLPAN
jgi:Malectin domain